MRQHDRSFAPRRPPAEVLAAAESGESEAQVSLAESLAAAGDGGAAALWLRRAVDGGNRYAAALLGAWQILGYHVDQDAAEGARRVEEAARAGESAARALLAYLYATGLAVEQDWNRALDWLVAAASLGNARALTQVGLLAADDAPPGLRITLWWAAATSHFSPAQLLLGQALASSDDLRSRDVGAAWIGTAALAGHPRAAALAGPNPPAVKAGAPVSVEGIDFAQVRSCLRIDHWLTEPHIETLSDSPRIATAVELVPGEVCDYLAGLAAPYMQPARVNAVAGGGPVQHGMRTNSYMQFELTNSDPLLALINHRLARLTGEPANLQENTAVLCYRPGQTYADHYDFIDPDVPQFGRELAERGQRVATALVYLNDGYRGGDTAFPLLGLTYRGRRGDALAFRNVNDSGLPDRRMLHAGRPPEDGEKWLLSKWVRDRNQLGRLW
jgi:TPR repeat protein